MMFFKFEICCLCSASDSASFDGVSSAASKFGFFGGNSMDFYDGNDCGVFMCSLFLCLNGKVFGLLNMFDGINNARFNVFRYLRMKFIVFLCVYDVDVLFFFFLLLNFCNFCFMIVCVIVVNFFML